MLLGRRFHHANASVVCVALAAWIAPMPAAAKSPVLELPRAERIDIPRARELDAAGVRAYREARYREALLLFTESYRLGGPSLELWNVARCHQRLDEGEDAAEVLGRYLEATDLFPGDRAEATRELNELRRRGSPLIVDVGSAGAPVSVDGRRIGVAPLVYELAPGPHVIRVDAGAKAREVEVEARYGRPIVVRPATTTDTAPIGVETETLPEASRRMEIDAQGGIYAHDLGSVFGRVGPSVTLGARAGIGRGAVNAFLGVRGEYYGTSWSSRTPEPPLAQCLLPDRFRASGLAGMAAFGGAWDATRVVRATLEIDAGAETFIAERGGGDVLEPSCSPSPGVVPLLGVRAEVAFELARRARLLLTPIAITGHPAYDGARRAPEDATGTWFRFGASLGLSYDVGM